MAVQACLQVFLYRRRKSARFTGIRGIERTVYPAPYAVDNERFARQAATLLPQRNLLRQRWGT